MLGTLEEYQKSDWKAHVPTLVHSYNATFHDTTGYSPFFLMFGRHPRLAIDAFLGLTSDTTSAANQTEYVRKLQERLHFAYKKAAEAAKTSSAQHKRHYDLNVRNSGSLQPGDRVLVKNVGLRGKQKLADRWERQPYVIVSQPNPDIPVYQVKLENSKSRKIRTLHRNLLLPFMGLPSKRLSGNKERITQSDPEQDVDSSPVIPLTIPGSSLTPEDAGQNDRNSLRGSEKDQESRPYIIPARREPGTPGLQPRSANQGANSDEETVRPSRTRRKPAWMNSKDWVMSHPQHTFFVDCKDVVVL